VEPLQVGDPAYVGVYRLTGRLGAGGMGRVFLGVSPGGRTVAVKLMLPEHAADSGFRQRFAREVAAARQVGGFHTATVVDADPAADPPWMVTAYIPGPSLEEVVRSTGPLDPAALRALGAGLAEGLSAVHAAGLIHRDLKPGNVIMAEDGPRIIDFGIARAVDTPSQTSSGVLIGTFSFMSPEQVRGERLGPESDVFSLGSVLAYAATGHGPFDAASLPAIIYRIAVEPPDLGSLSGPLQGVISACLAKNPADRPPLDQLLGALSALPGQSGLSWQPPFAAAPGLSPPGTTLPPPAATLPPPRHQGCRGKPGPVPGQASGRPRRRLRRCPGDSPRRHIRYPWRHGNQWRHRPPSRRTRPCGEQPAREPAAQYFQCSRESFRPASEHFRSSRESFRCPRGLRRKYGTGPSDRDDRLHLSGGLVHRNRRRLPADGTSGDYRLSGRRGLYQGPGLVRLGHRDRDGDRHDGSR
jgi:serine/threonine protein kinase